eukprot:TRINITY_DN19888_c0_g1_i1.p1 TRINITY_DN19888_c0_g1~~TRINITY_DN19888_c0_g1_i1.p1  ORF type:complete len:367 (+),score=97.90 TRINITY_DN19888_c0_g1_i1:61-1161(+)
MKRAAAGDWNMMRDAMKKRRAQAADEEEEKEALALEVLELKKQQVRMLVPAEKLRLQEEHFDIPEWAGKPNEGVHLAAFKGDAQVSTVMVDGCPYYLFGRNNQVCDVPLDHPSISRVHMALVHHEVSKAVYIIDLNTAHGTFINNKRIEPKKPVALRPDDCLSLGGSSRVYKVRFTPPPKKTKPAPKEPEKPVQMSAEQTMEREAQVMAAAIEIKNRGAKTEHKAKADFWDGVEIKKSVSPVPEVPVKLSHILLYTAESNSVLPSGEPATRSVNEAVATLTDYKTDILMNLSGKGTYKNFIKHAKKHSNCLTTASKNGFLGTLPNLAVPVDQEVAKAATALEQDSVSEPICSSQGVHLLYRHSNES